MIAVHIMGGIGNQLYQYACARQVALKNKVELKLEIFDCENMKNSHHNYYRLGDFNIEAQIATTDEVKNLPVIKESAPNFSPEIFNGLDNVLLYGYWQDGDNYFSEIEDVIRKEITPKQPFCPKAEFWKQKILSAECAVSLHIRHGDFLNPLTRSHRGILPMDYYEGCVRQLQQDFPNLTVFVFSDDLQWAKKNFKLEAPLEFVEGCERDCEELFLMSYCKHNIVANHSTFSWWGAWLNQNPQKKVFLPSQKYPDRVKETVPKNFTEVQVDFSKRGHIEFPPLVSFILYVANDFDNIRITLESIFQQASGNYEIIIIDASNDDSGNFCRTFAKLENVSVLREGISISKFAAWNKGLKIARGDYVLFMDGKTFIAPDMLRSLESFVYDYCKTYTEKQRGDYLYYENYIETYANIICSTLRLEKNAKGDIQFKGRPDEKFLLRVDSPFQNLPRMTELDLKAEQKCILLATKNMNNLLCTKIFKRHFLEKNNLHFEESIHGDENITLHFLINSFIYSKTISIVPWLLGIKI